jgi:hypothetical protein
MTEAFRVVRDRDLLVFASPAGVAVLPISASPFRLVVRSSGTRSSLVAELPGEHIVLAEGDSYAIALAAGDAGRLIRRRRRAGRAVLLASAAVAAASLAMLSFGPLVITSLLSPPAPPSVSAIPSVSRAPAALPPLTLRELEQRSADAMRGSPRPAPAGPPEAASASPAPLPPIPPPSAAPAPTLPLLPPIPSPGAVQPSAVTLFPERRGETAAPPQDRTSVPVADGTRLPADEAANVLATLRSIREEAERRAQEAVRTLPPDLQQRVGDAVRAGSAPQGPAQQAPAQQVSPRQGGPQQSGAAPMTRLPREARESTATSNGIPTVPETDFWARTGGNVVIPLPGGGDIRRGEDLHSFGLDRDGS